MTWRQTLVAYGASVAAVSTLAWVGVYISTAPQYRSGFVLVLPAVVVIVVLATAPPFLVLRAWAVRRGRTGFRHAILTGAGLGTIAYGGFVAVINGQEMLDKPWLAISVLASGFVLGAVGGFVFMAVERRFGTGR